MPQDLTHEELNIQPLVIVRIGTFDNRGRWLCSGEEKEQLREIFSSMVMQRISQI